MKKSKFNTIAFPQTQPNPNQWPDRSGRLWPTPFGQK